MLRRHRREKIYVEILRRFTKKVQRGIGQGMGRQRELVELRKARKIRAFSYSFQWRR